MSVGVHAGTFGLRDHVHVCIHVKCGCQRATPGCSLDSFQLGFEDRIFPCPRAHQVGQASRPASPRDPSVSSSPALELQTYATMPGLFI